MERCPILVRSEKPKEEGKRTGEEVETKTELKKALFFFLSDIINFFAQEMKTDSLAKLLILYFIWDAVLRESFLPAP